MLTDYLVVKKTVSGDFSLNSDSLYLIKSTQVQFEISFFEISGKLFDEKTPLVEVTYRQVGLPGVGAKQRPFRKDRLPSRVAENGAGAGAGLFWPNWSRSLEIATAPAPDQAKNSFLNLERVYR